MSNSFSSVMRLGRDAELKTVGSSTVCEFSAAGNTGFGDRKAALWVKCHLWGKQGEAVNKFLVKGKQVWVSGELSQREYDAKDGTKKTSLELNVRDLELVGVRSDSDSPAQESAPKQERRPAPAATSAPSSSQDDATCPF